MTLQMRFPVSELKEAKLRQKLLQMQLKEEEEASQAARIWLHEIFPKWPSRSIIECIVTTIIPMTYSYNVVGLNFLQPRAKANSGNVVAWHPSVCQRKNLETRHFQ